MMTEKVMKMPPVRAKKELRSMINKACMILSLENAHIVINRMLVSMNVKAAAALGSEEK
jgi:hypothetical protein